MRLGMRSSVVSAMLVAVVALCGFAASAEAVPTLTPSRTVPMPASVSYAPAPDGTFWATRPSGTAEGQVFHLGQAGEVLGEWTIKQSYFDPLAIGYYEDQVYIASPSIFEDQLYTWPVSAIGSTAPTIADAETEMKFGSVQFYFRINSAGIITAEFGQDDKIGLLDGNTAFGEHPYYGQTFMGAGINGGYKPGGTPFESCESLSGPVIGEPKPCGYDTGVPPSAQWGPEGLAYPDDVAPLGSEGLYVAEYDGYEYGTSISLIFTGVGGPFVEARFGSPGQIVRPLSMVRDPATGDLYVSEEGNRRIDVFSGGGEFLAAFGYGVRDGADAFESCGVEIGACQAGVSYSTDPHSLFDRLDLGPEGDLYAYEPKANQVQVFGLGAAAGSGSGAGLGGGGAMPISIPPPIGAPPKLKCPKGKVLKKVKGVKKCVKKPAKKHKHHKKHHHKGKHH
jgi:hypothetical protein